MREILSSLLAAVMLWVFCGANLLLDARAIQEPPVKASVKKNAIKFAFVFDGPSDKNAAVMEQFKKAVSKSVQKDYEATFPANLVFTGDWTENGVKNVSNKALSSDAITVISLGSLSSKYYNETKNKQKFVVTIDQYGIRELGEDMFNPVEQVIEKLELFKRLTYYKKVAILINESYYKTQKDWYAFLKPKLEPRGIEYVVIPVNGNVSSVLNKIPNDVDAVFVTPIYNFSSEQRTELYSALNQKKLLTFSSVGADDVELGALLGSGALELDKKLAEAASFNIQGYLYGKTPNWKKYIFMKTMLFS